jgi:hypothetical protein
MDLEKNKKRSKKKRRRGPQLNVKNVFYNGKPHGIQFNGKYYGVKQK